MAKNPKFRHWQTQVDIAIKRLSKTKQYKWMRAASYDDVYDHMQNIRVPSDQHALHKAYNGMESIWVRDGRPYFKIWPTMAQQLFSTRLEIDEHYLASPYDVFSVLIPLELSTGFGNAVLAAMVPDGDDRTLMIMWKSHDRGDGCAMWRVKIPKGQTVQNCLDESAKNTGWTHMRAPDMPRITKAEIIKDKSLFREILSVVVATCFFGVGMHEMVAPDVRQNVRIRERHEAMQRKKKTPRFMLEKQKEWLLGSEIDLPRDLVINHGTGGSKDAGRELSHGHIRSGHMRMQPCGKDRKDRKLIFVPPTWIRPDLPTATQHGYRIGKREEPSRTCPTSGGGPSASDA